jgi:hypothetical protein
MFEASLVCRKLKDSAFSHELWMTRLLAHHVHEHALEDGHPWIAGTVQGTVCKMLARQAGKPHKIRYDRERRDEAFETKRAGYAAFIAR